MQWLASQPIETPPLLTKKKSLVKPPTPASVPTTVVTKPQDARTTSRESTFSPSVPSAPASPDLERDLPRLPSEARLAPGSSAPAPTTARSASTNPFLAASSASRRVSEPEGQEAAVAGHRGGNAAPSAPSAASSATTAHGPSSSPAVRSQVTRVTAVREDAPLRSAPRATEPALETITVPAPNVGAEVPTASTGRAAPRAAPSAATGASNVAAAGVPPAPAASASAAPGVSDTAGARGAALDGAPQRPLSGAAASPASPPAAASATYGYMGVSAWPAPLDIESVTGLVRRLLPLLRERGVDMPTVLSSSASGHTASTTSRLVRAAEAVWHSPGADAEAKLDAELRAAPVPSLVSLLKWVLARAGRVTAECAAHDATQPLVLHREHGIVSWQSYLAWRAHEETHGFEPTSYVALTEFVDPAAVPLLDALMDFFALVATHGGTHRMKPDRLARQFGVLLMGLPEDASFADTYAAYVRATNATEHMILAFVRYHVAMAPPKLRLPKRLLRLIEGYPAMLSPDLDASAQTVSMVPATYVARHRRVYAPDLLDGDAWPSMLAGLEPTPWMSTLLPGVPGGPARALDDDRAWVDAALQRAEGAARTTDASRALPAFTYDGEPFVAPTAMDDMFAEVWADYLVSCGWSHRDEPFHRDASFAVVQLQQRGAKSKSKHWDGTPSAQPAWYVVEEVVPDDYREALEAAGFSPRLSRPMLRKLHHFRQVRAGAAPESTVAVVTYDVAADGTRLWHEPTHGLAAWPSSTDMPAATQDVGASPAPSDDWAAAAASAVAAAGAGDAPPHAVETAVRDVAPGLPIHEPLPPIEEDDTSPTSAGTAPSVPHGPMSPPHDPMSPRATSPEHRATSPRFERLTRRKPVPSAEAAAAAAAATGAAAPEASEAAAAERNYSPTQAAAVHDAPAAPAAPAASPTAVVPPPAQPTASPEMVMGLWPPREAGGHAEHVEQPPTARVRPQSPHGASSATKRTSTHYQRRSVALEHDASPAPESSPRARSPRHSWGPWSRAAQDVERPTSPSPSHHRRSMDRPPAIFQEIRRKSSEWFAKSRRSFPGTRATSGEHASPVPSALSGASAAPSPVLDASAPRAEAPRAPRVETPAAPRVETPAAPRVETPAVPRVETPAAPRVETPAAPGAVTATAPADEAPAAPTAAAPAAAEPRDASPVPPAASAAPATPGTPHSPPPSAPMTRPLSPTLHRSMDAPPAVVVPVSPRGVMLSPMGATSPGATASRAQRKAIPVGRTPTTSSRRTQYMEVADLAPPPGYEPYRLPDQWDDEAPDARTHAPVKMRATSPPDSAASTSRPTSPAPKGWPSRARLPDSPVPALPPGAEPDAGRPSLDEVADPRSPPWVRPVTGLSPSMPTSHSRTTMPLEAQWAHHDAPTTGLGVSGVQVEEEPQESLSLAPALGANSVSQAATSGAAAVAAAATGAAATAAAAVDSVATAVGAKAPSPSSEPAPDAVDAKAPSPSSKPAPDAVDAKVPPPSSALLPSSEPVPDAWSVADASAATPAVVRAQEPRSTAADADSTTATLPPTPPAKSPEQQANAKRASQLLASPVSPPAAWSVASSQSAVPDMVRASAPAGSAVPSTPAPPARTAPSTGKSATPAPATLSTMATPQAREVSSSALPSAPPARTAPSTGKSATPAPATPSTMATTQAREVSSSALPPAVAELLASPRLRNASYLSWTATRSPVVGATPTLPSEAHGATRASAPLESVVSPAASVPLESAVSVEPAERRTAAALDESLSATDRATRDAVDASPATGIESSPVTVVESVPAAESTPIAATSPVPAAESAQVVEASPVPAAESAQVVEASPVPAAESAQVVEASPVAVAESAAASDTESAATSAATPAPAWELSSAAPPMSWMSIPASHSFRGIAKQFLGQPAGRTPAAPSSTSHEPMRATQPSSMPSYNTRLSRISEASDEDTKSLHRRSMGAASIPASSRSDAPDDLDTDDAAAHAVAAAAAAAAATAAGSHRLTEPVSELPRIPERVTTPAERTNDAPLSPWATGFTTGLDYLRPIARGSHAAPTTPRAAVTVHDEPAPAPRAADAETSPADALSVRPASEPVANAGTTDALVATTADAPAHADADAGADAGAHADAKVDAGADADAKVDDADADLGAIAEDPAREAAEQEPSAASAASEPPVPWSHRAEASAIPPSTSLNPFTSMKSAQPETPSAVPPAWLTQNADVSHDSDAQKVELPTLDNASNMALNGHTEPWSPVKAQATQPRLSARNSVASLSRSSTSSSPTREPASSLAGFTRPTPSLSYMRSPLGVVDASHAPLPTGNDTQAADVSATSDASATTPHDKVATETLGRPNPREKPNASAAHERDTSPVPQAPGALPLDDEPAPAAPAAPATEARADAPAPSAAPAAPRTNIAVALESDVVDPSDSGAPDMSFASARTNMSHAPPMPPSVYSDDEDEWAVMPPRRMTSVPSSGSTIKFVGRQEEHSNTGHA